MKSHIWLLFLILIFFPSLALAGEVVFPSPAGKERLIVPLPDDWHLGSSETESNSAHSLRREYFPAHQSAKNWDYTIIVRVIPYEKELKKGVELEAAVDNTLMLGGICREHLGKPFASPMKINGYNAARYVTTCFVFPEAKAHAEDVYIRDLEFFKGIIVVGRHTVYQIQWNSHTDAIGDGRRKITEEDRKKFGEFFAKSSILRKLVDQSVILCEPGSDKHPCP